MLITQRGYLLYFSFDLTYKSDFKMIVKKYIVPLLLIMFVVNSVYSQEKKWKDGMYGATKYKREWIL